MSAGLRFVFKSGEAVSREAGGGQQVRGRESTGGMGELCGAEATRGWTKGPDEPHVPRLGVAAAMIGGTAGVNQMQHPEHFARAASSDPHANRWFFPFDR